MEQLLEVIVPRSAGLCQGALQVAGGWLQPFEVEGRLVGEVGQQIDVVGSQGGALGIEQQTASLDDLLLGCQEGTGPAVEGLREVAHDLAAAGTSVSATCSAADCQASCSEAINPVSRARRAESGWRSTWVISRIA